jgi:hypothetical protein
MFPSPINQPNAMFWFQPGIGVAKKFSSLYQVLESR